MRSMARRQTVIPSLLCGPLTGKHYAPPRAGLFIVPGTGVGSFPANLAVYVFTGKRDKRRRTV